MCTHTCIRCGGTAGHYAGQTKESHFRMGEKVDLRLLPQARGSSAGFTQDDPRGRLLPTLPTPVTRYFVYPVSCRNFVFCEADSIWKSTSISINSPTFKSARGLVAYQYPLKQSLLDHGTQQSALISIKLEATDISEA